MNIRFCGFGGQGILLAGRIMGEAAANAGRHVLQNQAYGSASRGGTCYSDVTISDSEIYELEPEWFDALIALSQQSADKFLPQLKPGGILITDTDLVCFDGACIDGFRHCCIGAVDIAHHRFERDVIANILMIGVLNKLTGILPDEILENAITAVVPKNTREINIEAYRLGRELADSL